jgi:hypothetical protein
VPYEDRNIAARKRSPRNSAMQETDQRAVSMCAACHHVRVIDTDPCIYGVGGIDHHESVRFHPHALIAQGFGLPFQISKAPG